MAKHMANTQPLDDTTSNSDFPEEPTLTEDIKMIIGGVATIVLIVVPIVLVRKLIRTIEESDTFKSVERTLGG